jgi:hypothetical protein
MPGRTGEALSNGRRISACKLAETLSVYWWQTGGPAGAEPTSDKKLPGAKFPLSRAPFVAALSCFGNRNRSATLGPGAPLTGSSMKIRKALSVVALALTGLAARAFLRRRRRAVAELRQRRKELGKLLIETSLVLRNLERELTFASNPPGSAMGSKKPTSTLSELTALRAQVAATSIKSLELQERVGFLMYLQVKSHLADLSAVEAEASALADEIEAFASRVRSARDAGERLP